jgi:hypothetical protein
LVAFPYTQHKHSLSLTHSLTRSLALFSSLTVHFVSMTSRLDQVGQTSCKLVSVCVNGKFALRQASSESDVECGPCKQQADCPKGTFFQPICNSTTDSACTPCPAGSYQNEVNRYEPSFALNLRCYSTFFSDTLIHSPSLSHLIPSFLPLSLSLSLSTRPGRRRASPSRCASTAHLRRSRCRPSRMWSAVPASSKRTAPEALCSSRSATAQPTQRVRRAQRAHIKTRRGNRPAGPA